VTWAVALCHTTEAHVLDRLAVRGYTIGPHRTGSQHSKGIGKEVDYMLSNLYLKLREKLAHSEDEEGQGMVEYALILVLIAVVVIIVLILLGNQVKNVFSNISAGLGA
jgi:pilus assembly protein Flp/PilA